MIVVSVRLGRVGVKWEVVVFLFLGFLIVVINCGVCGVGVKLV